MNGGHELQDFEVLLSLAETAYQQGKEMIVALTMTSRQGVSFVDTINQAVKEHTTDNLNLIHWDSVEAAPRGQTE